MITINTIPFSIYRHGGNKAEYLGPLHTDVDKDLMLLTSAAPKQTLLTYGNRRSSVNNISSVSVDLPNGDTERRDFKLELKGSVPVGTPDADIDSAILRMQNVVNDVALMKQIFVSGRIVA